MKIRIFATAIVIALIVAGLTWGALRTLPPAAAVAAIDDPHAGHDHGSEKASAPYPGEEVDDLFAEEDHEGPAGEVDPHAGHGHGDPGGEDGFCPEHRVFEAEDALCQGGRIGELLPGQGMKVRLAAVDAADKAGVTLSRVQTLVLGEGSAIPGRVAFNRGRLARITPLASGVVRRVRVRTGASVARGDIVAEIAMPEIAVLKSQFLAARAREAQTEATYRQEEILLQRGISSRRAFQEAEAEHRAARSASGQFRQQLLNFGLSPADLLQLVDGGDGSAVVPLRAPFAGTVVEMNTAVGEAVAPGTPLFTLADLDVLWIELSLSESQISQAEVGGAVQARFEGLPGQIFSGRIFQVGAAVDERTRSLKALAEVANPGHRLKVGMFGKVALLAGGQAQSLALPVDALQSIDGLPFVFVQLEPDLFELRRVTAGAQSEGMVAILDGLSTGEEVVSSQGFALKSEVLKARLGASCADH